MTLQVWEKRHFSSTFFRARRKNSLPNVLFFSLLAQTHMLPSLEIEATLPCTITIFIRVCKQFTFINIVRTILLIPIHDYWSMECNDDSQIRWNACCLNNATQDSGRAQWNYYYLWADSMSKCIIVGEMQLWIAASLCGKVSIGGNITRPKKKTVRLQSLLNAYLVTDWRAVCVGESCKKDILMHTGWGDCFNPRWALGSAALFARAHAYRM